MTNQNPESTKPLAALVEAMSQPGFYPDAPRDIEVKQTHISYAILAGRFVYKLKKPVHFAFIDCSRLERRLHFCLEEVRLNSRLAPRVYHGVFAILRKGDSFVLGPEVRASHPDAVEYTVKMRRLPDDRMLDSMLRAHRVNSADINAIARRIGEFHTGAETKRGWEFGSAAAIWRAIVSDIAQNETFIGQTLERDQYEVMDKFCRAFVKSHWDLMNERARGGRVREGHGDLRAEHVCIEGDEIEVIDCVEFSEQLRYGDVASDLAFLAMDIERLGAGKFSRELVDTYVEASGDDDLSTLMPLYKCYRASVRGKVESLRSLEAEVQTKERERSRHAAREYYALACRYARIASPAVIVTCGLSGTGKSTVARLIRHLSGFETINSDRVRKRLAGAGEYERAGAGYGSGIYSAEFTRRTYDEMIAEAGKILDAGRGVIVDATFKTVAERRRTIAIAERFGRPILFVECVADEGEVRLRLDRRSLKQDEVSDATFEIYRKQRGEFEPLNEMASAIRIKLDTSRDEDTIVAEIESALDRARSAAPLRE
ncbi:MAG: AAA family ATPase [Candidatus Binatus sp.]|uniref:bifunctional aminoglycoside phosphotransferase/ATP-binding protein n=1 Tax=Candidatus Binatus sp. TaxID=2811406 RepID=UPI0027255C84|nr:AAA family ATPase [Candidatus Binatus sp.]MDO8434107.1 AAA family ATPase [Candidatus Binatus sp.]